MPVLEKKSSQLHVSEPSSINVASDADSVPEVDESVIISTETNCTPGWKTSLVPVFQP